MKLWSERVFYNGGLMPACVETEDERITRVVPTERPPKGARSFSTMRLIPGLIDSHIHGCAGADTMDASYDALNTMSEYLVRHGVTSFLPTTVTDTLEKTHAALRCVAETAHRGASGARILGSYAEGPYITEEHKGAHPAELIREISLEEIEGMLQAAQGTLKSMILAPEKPGVEEAVQLLRRHGVRVSLGHSSATSEQTDAALAAGANTVVHLYNGMAPLHHRVPGLLGTALIRDCYTEIICDGFHVKSIPMQIAARCKDPGRVILITDCMCAGGMADGSYMLGELAVRVEHGAAYLMDNDSLAGSTLSLERAVHNYQSLGKATFEQALLAATANPARALGVQDQVGSLTPGKLADVVALNEAGEVCFVMVGGEVRVDEC